MTDGSGIDRARLTVLLDVRSPHCYLALPAAIAFGRELGIDINWLPLVVPPLNAPSEPAPEDDRGVRHRRYRAQAIAREIGTYAAAQGLVLREYYRSPDPSALNLAWLWLRDRRPDRLGEFLTEAFRAYWALELDPADPAALRAIVDSIAPGPDGFLDFCADQGLAVAARLAEELAERGLTGVPAYLVDGELFLGRQHLPMIRWILEGRAGPGPI